MITDKNIRYSRSDALNGLIKSAQKQTEWQKALRHLMTMHKLIHDLGEKSNGLLPLDKMQHMSRYNAPKSSTS
jgi:hypothetical protein